MNVGQGYRIRSFPVEYVGMDGVPFTFVDCLRETRGLAMVSIVAPNGRVVMSDAGSAISRRMFIDRYHARRRDAAIARHLADA